MRDVPPKALAQHVREAVREREPPPARVLVAGGDGSVATAAAAVCGSETELAILPGGTLNHFARDHGIPTEVNEAIRVAIEGRRAVADVAYAESRLFLNTSAVGAYVSYVRVRERFERYVGYRLASLFAAVRLFFKLRPVRVELEVAGVRKQYDTPLVFIGVGERELQAPLFGSRVPGGQHLLHVMVVRERRAARLLALALVAAARGVREIARTPELDSFLVERCTIGMLGTVARVALDGELVLMQTPVEYRIAAGVLHIVVP